MPSGSLQRRPIRIRIPWRALSTPYLPILPITRLEQAILQVFPPPKTYYRHCGTYHHDRDRSSSGVNACHLGEDPRVVDGGHWAPIIGDDLCSISFSHQAYRWRQIRCWTAAWRHSVVNNLPPASTLKPATATQNSSQLSSNTFNVALATASPRAIPSLPANSKWICPSDRVSAKGSCILVQEAANSIAATSGLGIPSREVKLETKTHPSENATGRVLQRCDGQVRVGARDDAPVVDGYVAAQSRVDQIALDVGTQHRRGRAPEGRVRRHIVRVAGRRSQQRRPRGVRHVAAAGQPDGRVLDGGDGPPCVVVEPFGC